MISIWRLSGLRKRGHGDVLLRDVVAAARKGSAYFERLLRFEEGKITSPLPIFSNVQLKKGIAGNRVRDTQGFPLNILASNTLLTCT